MKRSNALVAYASSDEDSEVEPQEITLAPITTDPRPSRTKRKLPRLTFNVIAVPPRDDPASHKGRVRTTPHVEGQFAAYVYVPVVLDEQSGLCKLLGDVARRAKELVPPLQSDWLEEPLLTKPSASRKLELHISLSRPIYLRHYQREDVKRAVKQAAQSQKPFIASFASFATFDNDERTRTFLGVEVGAGHVELKSLSDALTPTLLLLHQQAFYSDPRFHASFAWALLDQPPPPPSISLPPLQTTDYPTITAFPSTLLPELTREYGPRLATKLGVLEFGEVRVKIGKDVFGWPLAGRMSGSDGLAS